MFGTEDGYPALLIWVNAGTTDQDDFMRPKTVEIGRENGQGSALRDQVFGGKKIIAFASSCGDAYTE